ncbi:hypothetical protein GCM10007919_50360 [Rhizobium indigoferae]|nr:hypothetical protein GCM10007919_50360 [Rhizobium indigoferae]
MKSGIESDTGIALARLDERIARSPVGASFVERAHFADACASLWIDGELVHIEDLVLHDATKDIRTPAHELTIARDVLRTAGASPHSRRLGAEPRRSPQPPRADFICGGDRRAWAIAW